MCIFIWFIWINHSLFIYNIQWTKQGNYTKGKPPKKIHTLCEISQKIRDPLPLFLNNFSHFLNLKIVVFAIIRSLWMRGIDIKMFLLFDSLTPHGQVSTKVRLSPHVQSSPHVRSSPHIQLSPHVQSSPHVRSSPPLSLIIPGGQSWNIRQTKWEK